MPRRSIVAKRRSLFHFRAFAAPPAVLSPADSRSQKKLIGLEPPQQPLAKTSLPAVTSIECGPGASIWPRAVPVAGSTFKIHGDAFTPAPDSSVISATHNAP